MDSPPVKTCCTCKESLPVAAFGPSKQRKDGLRPRCKNCHRLANADWRKRSPDVAKEATRRWAAENPEKVEAKRQRWNERNPGRQTELARRWRHLNPERVSGSLRKRRSDPSVRLMRAIAQRIRDVVNDKCFRSTKDLLGYSPSELRSHLERQFSNGMSWQNYGQWHVDHIVPLVEFRLSGVEDPALKVAWGLPNLRPLWATDNLRKQAKRSFLV